LRKAYAVPFVIPSEAEGSAVQRTSRGKCFSALHEKNNGYDFPVCQIKFVGEF
jgi:hypothetical protein